MKNFFWGLSIVIALLMLNITMVFAQQSSFTPQRGSIGTVVFINCSAGSTMAFFGNQQIQLDNNGFGSFTVATAYAPGAYAISCVANNSGNATTPVGMFNVTECPLLNEQTLTDAPTQTLNTFSAQGGGNLTGENISVTGQDVYTFISDIDNGDGATARLIIRSSDPTRLVNYINSLTFDFTVFSGRPSEDLSNCNVDIALPFGVSQQPRIEDPSLEVELVLLSGQSILPESNYLIYFAVSSALEPRLNHVYYPENGSAIAGRLEDYNGFLAVSAWDDANSIGYNDIVSTYNPTINMPGVVSQSVQGAEFQLGVSNLVDNRSSYTLSGTFQTRPCDSTREECLGTVPEPESVVLAQGIGISSGNAVYNGNFEVESYCQQILPGSDVRRNDVDWFCRNDSGVETVLTEQDFTEICRQTYANPQAFAVRDLDLTTPDDSPSNIPAYNWRCLGPDPNA